MVNIEPMPPIASQMKIETISFVTLIPTAFLSDSCMHPLHEIEQLILKLVNKTAARLPRLRIPCFAEIHNFQRFFGNDIEFYESFDFGTLRLTLHSPERIPDPREIVSKFRISYFSQPSIFEPLTIR